ncbi:TRAP transporter small permease subunit [Halomonas sp. MCCC 1A17488]|nr:TRAP transporter small permease subunit [Halomonas sp. MCCC 1A17488]MCG3239576.1 TRAP transporter small permease subunit [Halomonas sp. MCCC 1A17488]QPP50508.1 TRAP transporter small permease subunit [Halomonas sp. SS10-MC5]
MTRERAHIEISFVKDALPEIPRGYFSSMLFLLATVACVWAGWYAFEEAMRQYRRGVSTMAVVSVPRWWMSAVISYGLVNSGIYFLRASIMEFQSSLTRQGR